MPKALLTSAMATIDSELSAAVEVTKCVSTQCPANEMFLLGLKSEINVDGKMSQWLKALAALGEDQSLVHSTHTGQLTTRFNSQSRRSDVLSGLSRYCTHMCLLTNM